jgi:hypothetical protein
MGDPCVSSIAVEPTSGTAWYVGGVNGLYMTKDGGQTWTQPLVGAVGALVLVPGPPQLVYVGVGTTLYLSRDKGKSWSLIRTLPRPVHSVLAAPDGRLYVGVSWSDHVQPSGIFVSNLGGGGPAFPPLRPGAHGTHRLDPRAGPARRDALRRHRDLRSPAAVPSPFFRSTDGGLTWTNVAGALPRHVIAAAVRPGDGFVYALTEGTGLFGSADKGATWVPPTSLAGPSGSLLMDPTTPTRLFGGRQKVNVVNGGIFVSVDAGDVFQPIGLQGATVAGLAVNGTSTRLFAAVYASGVYASPIPPSP